MTDTQQQPTRTTTPLGVFYVLIFLAFSDTFSLLPVLGPYAESLGARALGMGLVIGSYSVTDILFNMIGGRSIDRSGRRRFAIFGFAIITGAIMLYPLASTVPALIGVRLLHGIGGGILLPALYTLIGDVARQGARGRAMGRVGAVIGTAAVFGPAIGGIGRDRFGFNGVFIGLAVVIGIGLILTLLMVKETTDRVVTEKARSMSFRALWGIRNIRVACIAVFGFTFGFGSLSAFFSSHLEAQGHPERLSGLLFALLALVAAVLMLTRVSNRVDRQGPRRTVLIGMPMIALGLALIGITKSIGTFAAGMIFFGIGFGLIYPAATGAVAIASAAEGRGRAFGMFSVFYSLGFVIGPPLAGFFRDRFDLSPFLFAAGAALIALVVVELFTDDRTD